MNQKQRVVTGLAILLVLEITLFSQSFSMFFCGDSLYYISRRLETLSDVLNVFSKVDYLEEYRPLPFMLFSYIYFPLFKLDPFGYHFVPLIFHAFNTCLVFLLSRKLLKTDLSAFVATLFFGTHSVNFFITYDITMLTEFTYAFFYLLAILSFLRYLDTERKAWRLFCVLTFLLGLLSKESMITLLATATLAGIAYIEPRKDKYPAIRTLFYVLKKAWPLFVVSAVYLLTLLAMKGWSLYPRLATHPHHLEFSLRALAMNYKFLQWAFNFPDNLRTKPDALIIAVFLAPFILAFLVFLIRSIFVKRWVVWYGVAWFVASLSPVMFLPNLTMTHNLYVPIIGLALIFGLLAESAVEYLRSKRFGEIAGIATLLTFSVVLIWASWFNNKRNLRVSWLANGSVVAKNCLDDLKNARRDLPPDATLYFLRSAEKHLPWFFDHGGLFRVFYQKPSLRALFADRGAKLPSDYLDNNKVIILRFLKQHLYDVTEEFKADMRDNVSLKLLPLFSEKNSYFNANEAFLPLSGVFDTPTGKPVFLQQVERSKIAREALVTIAGARLRFDIPPVMEHSRLAFDVTMVFDVGDGAEGRVYFESDGKRNLLYSRIMSPAMREIDCRWFEESVDLSNYAGKKGSLIFQCNSGRRGNEMGDWVAWSRMRVRRPMDGQLFAASVKLRKPIWLDIIPARIRQGGYVIVTVGNGSHMTIDCIYKLNGTIRTKEKWFTANAAGQYAYQPTEIGKWEFIAIKNSEGLDWVETPALLVVE